MFLTLPGRTILAGAPVLWGHHAGWHHNDPGLFPLWRQGHAGGPQQSKLVIWMGWVGQVFIAITLGVLFAGALPLPWTALIERLNFLWVFSDFRLVITYAWIHGLMQIPCWR